MKRNISSLLFIVLTFTGLHGCNPYSSEFTCPKTENGMCASVADVYAESLRPTPADFGEDKNEKKGNKKAAPGEITWQGEMQRKINSLLKEPNSPIVSQPTVMRVLMLPYRGDQNELYMMRFVYMFVDEPRWVLGDYLLKNSTRMDGVQ